MSRPTVGVSYRAVLGLPGARSAFAFATLGRLSFGTLPLALLFMTQQATDSFGVAGTVMAVFGLMTMSGPAKSRMVDRFGPPLVLTVLGLLYAVTLLALAAVGGGSSSPKTLLILLAAIAGATVPPLGPVMRSLWSELAPDVALRQRAYSLDAVAEEALYSLGPVLVGLMLTAGSPDLAVAVSAVLAALGAIGLGTCPAARRFPVHQSVNAKRFGLGPLRAPRFRSVLITILGAGLGLGVLDVAVAARATAEGDPAAAGYLLAAMTVGSAVGGLWWGQRSRGSDNARQLTLLAFGIAVGVFVAGWITNLLMLGAALFLTGSLIAPAFIVSYLAADQMAPASQRTEANTWVNTLNNLGTAGGAAIAGVLVDRTTVTHTFVAGAVLVALAGITLLATRARGATGNQRL